MHRSYSRLFKPTITLFLFLLLGSNSVFAQDSLNITHLSSLFRSWGGATQIQLEDSLAYVSTVNNGIAVLDIHDLASPRQIAYRELPRNHPINNFAVSGNYAYIAARDSGLRILDVHDTTNIHEVGYYVSDSSRFVQVVVRDTLAFVLDSSKGVLVFNISNPNSFQLLGSCQFPFEFTFFMMDVQMVIDGNHAYVSAGTNGMRIIDISNPSNPNEVGHYDSTTVQSVNELNGVAYVSDRMSGSVLLLDVSHPDSIRLLSSYEDNGYSGVSLSDSLAFMFDGAVEIVNVTDPTQPQFLGYYYNYDAWWPTQVIRRDSVAFVADYNCGFEALNINNTGDPTRISVYEQATIYQAKAVGDYAYVAANDGLHIVNVQNPSSPFQVGFYPSQYLSAVAINGDYVYITDWATGRLLAINITNPATPTVAGSYAAQVYSENIVISGNYLYLTDLPRGFQIYDISNPVSPHFVHAMSTFGNTLGITVSGNFAYLACDTSGFRIIDISNPHSPYEVSRYNNEWSTNHTRAVSIVDTIAYVVDGGGQLMALSIADSSNPYLMGECSCPRPFDIYVTGNRAYLACDDGGLRIYNVARADSIYQTGFYRTESGYAYSVSKQGNIVYVANDVSFDIFDCTAGMESVGSTHNAIPFQFELKQNYPNPFNGWTAINYSLPVSGKVSLTVYDALGRKVATLVDGYQSASRYRVRFDASKLASGVYFYQLNAGKYHANKKMVMVK